MLFPVPAKPPIPLATIVSISLFGFKTRRRNRCLRRFRILEPLFTVNGHDG